jgi:DNA-directed RNA polymerase subunit L
MHFENYTFVSAHKHTFDVDGVDVAVVNALRRIILTDLPNVGFRGEPHAGEASTVEVLENDGPLHNEIMQHRIGLVPICYSEEEAEAFAPDAADVFELNVTNTSVDVRSVSAQDFVVRRGGVALPGAEVRRLFPCHPATGDAVLITQLRQHETLHIVARPVRSTPREHAGFCAVSQCAYAFSLDEARANKASDPLDKERAYQRNAHGDPTRLQFRIEVENAFSVRYIVDKAFDVLLGKLARARQGLLVDDADVVRHASCDRIPNGHDFTFVKEDDTLGNVLQSLIHNDAVREGNGDISYVGYFCPHPLDEAVVVRIVAADGAEPASALLLRQIERITKHIEVLRAEWADFAPKN